MKVKIVSESAANIYKYKNVTYTCLANTIDTAQHQYEDHRGLDVSLMMDQLKHYHGKTEVIAPSVEDWYNTYGEDITFVLPNASILSNSYNNALLAKHTFEKEHPDKKVFVLNTNTTGPALKMMNDYLIHLLENGTALDAIIEKMNAYMSKVNVLISFEKPSKFIKKHFKKNSDTISTIKHSLNEKNIQTIIDILKNKHFNGKKLVISHTGNIENLSLLKERIMNHFGPVHFDIIPNSGINAYYYGNNAIMIGYEK